MDSCSSGRAQESSGGGGWWCTGGASDGVICRRPSQGSFVGKTLKHSLSSSSSPLNHFQNPFGNGELQSQRRRLGGREAGDVSVEREKSIVLRGDAARAYLLFFSLATSFAESASTCNAVFAVASRPLRHHRSALRFAHAHRVERAGSLNAISRRKTCAIEASGPRVKTREKKDVACACTLAPPFFSLTSSF